MENEELKIICSHTSDTEIYQIFIKYLEQLGTKPQIAKSYASRIKNYCQKVLHISIYDLVGHVFSIVRSNSVSGRYYRDALIKFNECLFELSVPCRRDISCFYEDMKTSELSTKIDNDRDRLLTPEDAAKKLGISRRTFDRIRTNPKTSKFFEKKFIGGRAKYSLDGLADYLDYINHKR